MMKFQSLFLVVVCAVALKKTDAMSDDEHKEIHELMMPILAECSEKHGTSPEDIIAVKKTKDVDGVDSCLIECVFKKMEVMDDDGKFVEEKFVESMKKIMKKDGDSDKVEQLAKNCASVTDKDADDKCEKAKALLACLMEQKDLVGL